MGVFPVPPRHPRCDLREAHVQRLSACGTVGRFHQHLSHDAPVAVMLIELDADFLPRHQLDEPIPGCVAEELALLGCVIPAMRTLCCSLLESRTEIVSPSAILTTVPSRTPAAEEEDETERRMSMESRNRRDRVLSKGNTPRSFLHSQSRVTPLRREH